MMQTNAHYSSITGNNSFRTRNGFLIRKNVTEIERNKKNIDLNIDKDNIPIMKSSTNNKLEIMDPKNFASSIISQERSIKILNDKLDSVNLHLKRKESEMQKVIEENRQLKNEINLLKEEMKISGSVTARSKLLGIIKETNLELDNIEQMSIETLIDSIKLGFHSLIKEKEEMEKRYNKIFDLHTRQIAVNSKKNSKQLECNNSELLNEKMM